jgi:DNA-binding CsgD family transcriptional regulator
LHSGCSFLGQVTSTALTVRHRLPPLEKGSPNRQVESIRHSSYLWGAVASLASRDAERLLRFVAEAGRIGGDQPFTPELLVELGELVHADWVAYCELDRVRRSPLANIARAGDEDDRDADDVDDVFWSIVIDEHPVCVRHQQGHFEALKLSDFLTQRELHASRLFDVWFKPSGIEYELNVAIPSPLWHTKTFLFDRASGRDFTERDRLVLDTLQPYLADLWAAARTRRLLKAALASLDGAEESGSHGVILLSADREVEFASAPARRQLREFFGASGRAIPPEIADWLESGATSRLAWRSGSRLLTVTRKGDALLLDERLRDTLLTAREREVMAWVARGKTNPEIARILWLAPSTVSKHLENVYAKLGVGTRTAAVARFLGLLEAEAS